MINTSGAAVLGANCGSPDILNFKSNVHYPHALGIDGNCRVIFKTIDGLEVTVDTSGAVIISKSVKYSFRGLIDS